MGYQYGACSCISSVQNFEVVCRVFFFWKMCEPLKYDKIEVFVLTVLLMYEGHLESKERFAIQRYLLIRGKKKNMQVL